MRALLSVRDDRTHLYAFVQTDSLPASAAGSVRNLLGERLVRVAHGDRHRRGQATLARAAEGGIGHDARAVSMSASGMITTGFLAPAWHCARLPLAVARL